jgi:hypothetical protein
MHCHFEKRDRLIKTRVLIQSDRASGFGCEDPVRGTCFLVFFSLFEVQLCSWLYKSWGVLRGSYLRVRLENMPCLVLLCVVLLCPFLCHVVLCCSCVVRLLSCVVLRCLVLSCVALSWFALPCLVSPTLALPCLGLPCCLD